MTLTRTSKFLGGLEVDVRDMIHADNANHSIGVGIEDSISANVHIRNDNADTVLRLETRETTDSPVKFDMFKNSSSPGNNDNVAQITYSANSDADATRSIFTTHIQVTNVTDGAEDFSLKNYAILNGSQVNIDNFDTTGYVFNEDASSLDFRVEGSNNTHLLFIDASTDRIGINDSSPIGKFTIINDNQSISDVVIENSGVAVDFGPELVLKRTKTGVTGDLGGRLSFQSADDADVNRNLGDIYCELEDAGTGTYEGRMFLRIFSASAGSITAVQIDPILMSVNAGQDDMDYRFLTPSNINRFYVNAGTDKIGIGTNVPGEVLDIEDGNVQLSTNNTGIKLNSASGNTFFLYVDNVGSVTTVTG